jgi:DNA invertase Pin-like site-specific DNA recombinase
MKLRESIQARAILALKAQGFTEPEIVLALGLSRTTVQRRRKKARAVADQRPRAYA